MTLSSDAAIVSVDPSRGPFSLLLRLTAGPPSTPHPSPAASQHDQAEQDTRRGICPMKILLVEDDERLSRSLARLLEQERHHGQVDPGGETGLDIALGENGIDVVVLDIGLPDISGLDGARRMRQDLRELADTKAALQ